MAVFKDLRGRTWAVDITLGTLARVKSESGLDLLTIHQPDSSVLERLTSDPALLLQTIVAVIRPQLQQQGVTETEFGDSLAEQQAWDATEALLRGLCDYYPPEKRAAMHRLLDAVLSAARNVNSRATAQLAKALGTMEPAAIEQQIERAISGASMTSSPASSASTPAR